MFGEDGTVRRGKEATVETLNKHTVTWGCTREAPTDEGNVRNRAASIVLHSFGCTGWIDFRSQWARENVVVMKRLLLNYENEVLPTGRTSTVFGSMFEKKE